MVVFLSNVTLRLDDTFVLGVVWLLFFSKAIFLKGEEVMISDRCVFRGFLSSVLLFFGVGAILSKIAFEEDITLSAATGPGAFCCSVCSSVLADSSSTSGVVQWAVEGTLVFTLCGCSGRRCDGPTKSSSENTCGLNGWIPDAHSCRANERFPKQTSNVVQGDSLSRMIDYEVVALLMIIGFD